MPDPSVEPAACRNAQCRICERNRVVRSWLGLVMNAFASFRSAIGPASMKITRLATWRRESRGIFDRLQFGVTRPAALISPCSARGECLVTPGAGNSGDGDVALRLESDERREDLFAADDYDADAIRRTRLRPDAEDHLALIDQPRQQGVRSASLIGTIACRSSSAMSARAFQEVAGIPVGLRHSTLYEAPRTPSTGRPHSPPSGCARLVVRECLSRAPDTPSPPSR